MKRRCLLMHSLRRIGFMLVNVTQALGELCIMYPVSGGYYALSVVSAFVHAVPSRSDMAWALVSASARPFVGFRYG